MLMRWSPWCCQRRQRMSTESRRTKPLKHHVLPVRTKCPSDRQPESHSHCLMAKVVFRFWTVCAVWCLTVLFVAKGCRAESCLKEWFETNLILNMFHSYCRCSLQFWFIILFPPHMKKLSRHPSIDKILLFHLLIPFRREPRASSSTGFWFVRTRIDDVRKIERASAIVNANSNVAITEGAGDDKDATFHRRKEKTSFE